MQNYSIHGDTATQEEHSRIIEEGNDAKAKALQYADWLITTCNNSMPDDDWSFPQQHPYAVLLEHIPSADEGYQDLVNAVQRHTRCSAAYCLRKKRGQQEDTCRFDYPRPLQDVSTMQFEKLDDGTVRATLTTKQNDPRVNSHNRTMLQNWMANVDRYTDRVVSCALKFFSPTAWSIELRRAL